MSVVMLRTSSIAMTDSSLGVEENLPSFFAAMVVRASVAFLEMVSRFIIGTLPIFRLKTRVDLSASLTASLNLLRSASSFDSVTVLAAELGLVMSIRIGVGLPEPVTCFTLLGGACT